MTLAERLSEYVRACFTGLWVRTHEPDDASAEIAALCHKEGWSLATWDVDRGLALAGAADGPGAVPGAADPLAAIRSLPALARPDGTAILALRNFHKFLNSAEVVQALDTRLAAGKLDRTFVVVLSPVVQVPAELEKLFVVVEHDLPGRDQLGAIARGVATEPGELPEGEGLDAVLDAAAGLTRVEAENAFSLSLVRHGRLAPDVLWEIKSGTLRKSGLLTLHRGGKTFAGLGGLDALKSFCSRALRPGRPEGVRAKGVLLLGPPGSGKSAFGQGPRGPRRAARRWSSTSARCSARSSDRARPTSARPCGWSTPCRPAVVMVDEVEKALAGSSGPSGDSGVSARLFGTLLSWLNDRESDSFVVCTANDISKLPPEFARSERFDATFFLDLPGPGEREAIWRMYRERYGVDPAAPAPETRDWTAGGDQIVLPAGGPARRPAVRGGREHRPGRGHRGRGGRAAAVLGRRALPVGRPAGPLHAGRPRSSQAGPQRPARPVVQLSPALAGPAISIPKTPKTIRDIREMPPTGPSREYREYSPATPTPGIDTDDHAARPPRGLPGHGHCDHPRPAAPLHHGRRPRLVHLDGHPEDPQPRPEGPRRRDLRRRGPVPLRRQEAPRHRHTRPSAPSRRSAARPTPTGGA